MEQLRDAIGELFSEILSLVARTLLSNIGLVTTRYTDKLSYKTVKQKKPMFAV